VIFTLCAAEQATAGRPRPPAFTVNTPSSGSNFASGDSIPIAVAYDTSADPQGLRIRVNEGIPPSQEFLAIPPEAIGTGSTSFLLPPGPPLRAGRNVLSAFVPSTDPEAELNGGFLVRHRVFFVGDQDHDGVADGAEVGAGATLVDSDGDGLLDGVERRIGVASAEGIPETSRTGAITVARVRPTVLRRGRAFAIGGAGLEGIDAPGEVSLGGLLAPLVHLPSAPSPSVTIAQAPAGVAGPSALLALADVGGSSGSVVVSIDMDSVPMLQNLVLVSSIRAQQFFDDAGGLLPSRAHNIPLFVNMLQFGSSTRVLIDATRISLPVGPYAPSELAAIADWLRVPGRRLVVVSDSCCGPSPASSPPIANGVLAAVGAASRFDPLFPSSESRSWCRI
jgi:hypothetical protein